MDIRRIRGTDRWTNGGMDGWTDRWIGRPKAWWTD